MDKKEDCRIIHKDYTCNGCDQENIEGIRYKCAVCADFDFCQKCEASIDHSHPFLKIRNPKQAPLKLIAVIRDEENNLEVNGHKIPPNVGLEQMVNRGLEFLTTMGPTWGQAAQNPFHRRPHSGCGFFRNFMQNNFQGCPRGQETEKEEQKKEE